MYFVGIFEISLSFREKNVIKRAESPKETASFPLLLFRRGIPDGLSANEVSELATCQSAGLCIDG